MASETESGHGKTAEDYAEQYTEPELRERLKEQIKAGSKGGKPGQWSARKSQLLAHEYEAQGGGYRGEKGESQQSLEQWTAEEWQTKEGSADARQTDGTVKRYLPRRAWEHLSDEEKRANDRKKRRASREGVQFVANTPAARRARREAQADGLGAKTKRDLLQLARKHDIPGRSAMDKGELVRALEKATARG